MIAVCFYKNSLPQLELIQSLGIGHDPEQDLSERIKAYSDALRNIVPIGLVPDDLAEILRHDSNHRLDLARQQGITLDQIFIGDDCLPTWHTFCWDPEDESLHSVIQKRLLHHEVAKELGGLIQNEICVKSNRKLREAEALGISIEDLTIGKTLLPEWNADDNGNGCQDTSICISDDASSDDVTWFEGTSDTLENTATPLTDVTQCAFLEPSDLEDPTFFRDLAPDDFWDSDYEDGYDEGDEIYLNNFVSTHPVYDEYGNSNIVHDVEIVGGACQFADADLEVYLAVDDEDFEDLPEVELAIDKEAFEYHFGDQGAVDVFVPGAELFCFDEIEEYEDDGMDEDDGIDNGHPPPTGDSYHIELDEDDDVGQNNEGYEHTAMEISESDHNESDSEMYSEEE